MQGRELAENLIAVRANLEREPIGEPVCGALDRFDAVDTRSQCERKPRRTVAFRDRVHALGSGRVGAVRSVARV